MFDMQIEHIALWTRDLEGVRDFYMKYFKMKSSEKYVNPDKGFSSYFLSFNRGARIEIMNRKDMENEIGFHRATYGLAHFAISVGSKEKVDRLTEVIRNDGFEVIGEPRTTGDGFYESVVSDPEGNHVEITE